MSLLPLDINYTRKGSIFFDDHDSGGYILCFKRKTKKGSKVECQLRDSQTWEIKKWLKSFYLQYRAIYELCYEGERITKQGEKKGKDKSNNLHVECHRADSISPNDYEDLDEFIEAIQDIFMELRKECNDECFSEYGLDIDECMDEANCDEHYHYRAHKKTNKCFHSRNCGDFEDD